MNFILHNNIFEIIIGGLFALNCIYVSIDDAKKDVKDITAGIKEKTGIESFKILYIIFCLVMFVLISFKNQTIFSLFFIFVIVGSFIGTIKHIKNNNPIINEEVKSMYIFSSLLFLIFFSSFATSIYLVASREYSHITKEILGLLFINIKIILFVFSLLINLVILVELVLKRLNKKHRKWTDKLKKMREKKYTLIVYNFDFYNKYKTKTLFIIDVLIFIITTPLGLAFTILKFLIVKIIIKIYSSLLKIISYMESVYNNRNKLLVKIIKITIIVSVTITNIIIIWNRNIFSNELYNMFNFISSVILIPLIYDQLKGDNYL